MTGVSGAPTRVAFEPCELAALTVRELVTELAANSPPALLFFERGPTDEAGLLRFLVFFSSSTASSACMSGTDADPGGRVKDTRAFGSKAAAAEVGGVRWLQVEPVVSMGDSSAAIDTSRAFRCKVVDVPEPAAVGASAVPLGALPAVEVVQSVWGGFIAMSCSEFEAFVLCAIGLAVG